jgi:DNA-binding response OmpR family regulator
MINEDLQAQVVLRKLLSSPDTDISCGLGGREGASHLRSYVADVIITDYTLSYKSGLEWLMYIRNHAINPEAKIIVLSALQDPETELLMQKIGITRHIAVPFEPSELLRELNRYRESDAISAI